jgi:hypothetical protein
MEVAIERRAIRNLCIAAVIAASFALLPATARAGTEHNVTGWAWSASIGWISLNCTNPLVPTYPSGTCGTVNYGVTIDNTPGFGDRGDLSGWAWSETLGWVCFGLSCAGPTPEGGAPYAQYRETFNGKNDQFWGWAQVINMGANGWIALNCDKDVGADDCGSSNHFVTLNDSTGDFTNGAANDHWGWGKNDEGSGVGWVDFSIVNTSWTLAKIGIVHRPQGVFEPDNPGLVGTHLTTFPIRFTQFSAPSNFRLECDIDLPDGSKKIVGKTLTSTVFNSTTTLDYTVQNSDPVELNKLWFLTGCRIGGYVTSTACASDATCAPDGFCDEGAGFCRDIVDSTAKRRPIFTHVNAWTGLDAQQDQYLAIKCNAGFPNTYFRNAAQCDFAGDASFALAMRRGIPVEGYCHDLVDNDGNGQTDCDDRYCQGLTYICPPRLPRTACVWGQAGDGIIDCSDGGYALGDLCCSRQPTAPSGSLYHIVDGLECEYDDPNDGYFNCDCAPGLYGVGDCYAPGYQAGDLCCSAEGEVIKP